jgi:glycerophosphoryl diester phosphodiesterase
MQLPELVAHRGWARRYPENTLAALEAAIGAGARWVEIDVQLSADGFPVLFHDRSLERMCGVHGAIHQRTLADLRALACAERGRFGERFAGEGIASLAGFVQLLRRHPEVRAFVEVKRAAIEAFGAARVLERILPAIEPALRQVALISFSLPFLAHVRAWHPIPVGAVFDRWDEREQPVVREIAPEYVFCDVEGLPAEGALAHAGARIAVYEVAEREIALALAARGVELVETFAIGELIASFSALGERV